MTRTPPELAWREVHWPVPLDARRALELLHRLSSDEGRERIVWEARGRAGRVRHFVGADPSHIAGLVQIVTSIVHGTTAEATEDDAPQFGRSARLRVRPPDLDLAVDQTSGVTRAILAALAAAHLEGERVTLQAVLGRGLPPRSVGVASDPTLSWFDQLVAAAPPSADVVRRMRGKYAEPGFEASIRVAATADSEARRLELVRGVWSALRTLQSPGTRLELLPDRPKRMRFAVAPKWFPLRLSSSETLALLAWPLEATDLPGMLSVHPKLLSLKADRSDETRVFALTTAPGASKRLGISMADALTHTAILGPTNSGKSTVMLNLIASDIAAGRGVVVIDPKGDLVTDVLARIPGDRESDVVVLDPTHRRPVGLNPLRTEAPGRELAADRIVGIFRELFPTMFGPRTADVLHASLLTLVAQSGATLAWLPRMLTDPGFRAGLTRGVDDVELTSFWDGFDAMSARAQLQFIGPVLSRLRQFLLRPGLRRVLDQSEPRFAPREVFERRRILLVPLNTGLIGGDAARLLGSLLVGELWQLTLGRAGLAPERRSPVSIYVDETQEFVRLGHDLDDALARSRSLGVAWHLAHQFRDQLPPETRAAIDANALNKIVFTLGARDARDLAATAPELSPEDFMALDRFEIYARLVQHGRQSGWVSGKTLRPPPRSSDPVALIAASQARYGAESAEPTTPYRREAPPEEPIGRQKRRRP